MDFDKFSQSSTNKRKRLGSVFLLIVAIVAGIFIGEYQATNTPTEEPVTTESRTVESSNEELLTKYSSAVEGLEALSVKGRAPKTGYSRAQFGGGWESGGGCDTRNRILARDLKNVQYDMNNCIVLSGTLEDPYTGKTIQFLRGQGTSEAVQIDHVVALSDSWQKGAQFMTPELRQQFSNDGLNLLAVDGPANQKKGDGDAATWLPSNKPIRCSYIARQISVKLKYSLWVTAAEKTAMQTILKNCPNQPLKT